jgi:hypothetical protein
VGSATEELEASYLGRVTALVSHEPIYEAAWQERERLLTTPAGRVFVQVYVVTRHREKHSIDGHRQQSAIE